jgi:curved DNA-binding protein CbpA
MTDFFALFDQPRQPWLEPNVIKEKYHQLTRLAHPDAASSKTDIEFEAINEGYRVLSDTRLRIQHLLALDGRSRRTGESAVPGDLQDLFLEIGPLTQKTQRYLGDTAGASSALTRSLRQSEALELRSRIKRLLDALVHLLESCLAELQKLNEVWEHDRSRAALQLQILHDRMSYLSRWVTQLRELEFQLTARD